MCDHFTIIDNGIKNPYVLNNSNKSIIQFIYVLKQIATYKKIKIKCHLTNEIMSLSDFISFSKIIKNANYNDIVILIEFLNSTRRLFLSQDYNQICKKIIHDYPESYCYFETVSEKNALFASRKLFPNG